MSSIVQKELKKDVMLVSVLLDIQGITDGGRAISAALLRVASALCSQKLETTWRVRVFDSRTVSSESDFQMQRTTMNQEAFAVLLTELESRLQRMEPAAVEVPSWESLQRLLRSVAFRLETDANFAQVNGTMFLFSECPRECANFLQDAAKSMPRSFAKGLSPFIADVSSNLFSTRFCDTLTQNFIKFLWVETGKQPLPDWQKLATALTDLHVVFVALDLVLNRKLMGLAVVHCYTHNSDKHIRTHHISELIIS